MAQSATVLSLSGQVLVINAAGAPRLLAVGERVELGDTIRPAPGAVVELSLDDGQTLTLGGDQALQMGAEAPTPADPNLTDALQSVIQVLDRGGDLDELEAAAAGLAGGGEGDGSSFVRLLRISEGVTPLSYTYGFEPGQPVDTIEGRAVAPETQEPPSGPPPAGTAVAAQLPEASSMTLGVPGGADPSIVLTPQDGTYIGSLGTVVVVANGQFTYVAPVVDHDSQPNVEVFTFNLVGAGGVSVQSTVTFTITDTAPQPGTAELPPVTEVVDVATSSVVLTFTPGADAMDTSAYTFALPQEGSEPTVGGLAPGQLLTWSLVDGKLVGTASNGGTITLSLSDASGNGVTVTAAVSGNLLHTDDTIAIGNVVVNAADTDGSTTQGWVSLSVLDTTPTLDIGDAGGMASGTVFTGEWAAYLGADLTEPVVSHMTLDGVTVNGMPATGSFDFDASTATGTGTFTYGSPPSTIGFTLTLNSDGSYNIVLDAKPVVVEITPSEYVGATEAGGPVSTFIIHYTDADTGQPLTATVAAAPQNQALALLGMADGAGTTVTYSATTVGAAVNPSGTGIGLDNNNLSSYVDKQSGALSTESLLYNPEKPASSITLNFKAEGSVGFGQANQTDVLHLDVTGTNGETMQLVLDSRFGDFQLMDGQLVPLTQTSYSGGPLESYVVATPQGWDGIESIQVTAGFSSDDRGTYGSDVKLAFGFSTETVLEFDQPIAMDFTATAIDADNDSTTSSFSFQTVLGEADGVDEGTSASYSLSSAAMVNDIPEPAETDDGFTLAHVDDGGDSIDLGDMLDTEDFSAANLDNYLSFGQNDAGHAVMHVATGEDLNGDGVPDALQSITLDNVSLLDLQAYAGGDSDIQIIQKLLDNGNLRKDA